MWQIFAQNTRSKKLFTVPALQYMGLHNISRHLKQIIPITTRLFMALQKCGENNYSAVLNSCMVWSMLPCVILMLMVPAWTQMENILK